MGIISHGLSHKFECIYLFSSVDVLECVSLHRGVYLHKTVSTLSVPVTWEKFVQELMGGVCIEHHPRGGSGYSADFHVVWITVHAYPVSVVGLHVCMTFAL